MASEERGLVLLPGGRVCASPGMNCAGGREERAF